MLVVAAGFIAGLAHVLAGPDHFAALAPLAVDQPRRAARIGTTWGLGHGLGVILLGALGQGARTFVDVDLLSQYAELLVGIVLVAVGVWALHRSRRLLVHHHSHEHGEQTHIHPHIHLDEHDHARSTHEHTDDSEHSGMALGVGFLHGAAGTGHLFGVLPSLALEPLPAATYLGAYLVAAIGAMTGFGFGLGWLARHTGTRTLQRLLAFTALGSIVVGLVWLVVAWSRMGTGTL
ncbi:MAG: hypothetical protein QGG40_19415, partial [Myxococcota bacterium]|nr:hypothetical protein [Myxococcota bacterium]